MTTTCTIEGTPPRGRRGAGAERASRSAALVLAAAVVGSGAPTDAQAEQVLRASPLGPPGHLLNAEVLRGWAGAVAEATQGRVTIEVLSQAVAPPPQLLAAIRRGAADLAILSNGASEQPLPLNALVEFAGQTPSAERSSVAYQHVASRHRAMTDELDGVEVLANFTHGPGVLLLAGPDAVSTGTMNGAPLHAGGNGAADAARAIGATVVMGPGPSAKALLAERRVEGTVTAIETLRSFDLAPSIRTVVLMRGGFYAAGFSVVANRARWAGLPAEDRAAILQVSGEWLARFAGRAWDRADAQALRDAASRGIAVVDAAPALDAQVRSASDAREARWLAASGAPDEARSVLDDYRRELRYDGP